MRRNKKVYVGVFILALAILGIFLFVDKNNTQLFAVTSAGSCAPSTCASGYTDQGVSCSWSGLSYTCQRTCYKAGGCSSSFSGWNTKTSTYAISPSSNNQNFGAPLVSESSSLCYVLKGESTLSVSNWDAGGLFHFSANSVKLSSFFGDGYRRDACSGGQSGVNVQSSEINIGRGTNGNGNGAIASFVPYSEASCAGGTAYGVTGTLTVSTLYKTAPYITEDTQRPSCSGSVQCRADSDCGSAGYTGSKFCTGNNVYQKYQTPSCSSYTCNNNQQDQLVESCQYGCSNGACSAFVCSDGAEQCDGTTLQTCSGNQWTPQGNVEGKCGYTTGVCTNGNVKCESTNYFVCSNSQWSAQGQVVGKCGYTGGTTETITVYRVQSQVCSAISILPSQKLSTDFNDLTSCLNSLSGGEDGGTTEKDYTLWIIIVSSVIGVLFILMIVILIIRRSNAKK